MLKIGMLHLIYHADANFLQNFSCADINSSSVCSGARGLFTVQRVILKWELEFKYTVESLNSIYMAEGISILSE